MVEEFIHNLEERLTGTHLEILNIDSRDGSATASLYDIMQHPAVLVLQSDGYPHKTWQGPEEVPPLIDEVASYARL